MTIFEFLKSKSIDEIAEYLDEYGIHDNSPWILWWDENYCHKCNAVEQDGFDYSWCELNGKCKFFPEMNNVIYTKDIIKLWLESEYN